MDQKAGYSKVSVITICYNSVKTLEQTIQSIINQTYRNIEYIIIDGGSTDGTLDIIKKYASEITYWVSEKDNGISDAFNKGLAVATGEIIGILNADDIYTERAIELAVRTLEDNPGIGFVFGDMHHADAGGNIIHKITGDPNYKNSIRFTMPAILHPTVFVRRNVYLKHGYFNLNFKTAMDYEFFLRITVLGAMGMHIPQVLAIMRLGGESTKNITRGCKEVMIASTYYGYNKYLACGRFCIMCVKIYARKLLEKLGLHNVVKLYRYYIDGRYKFSE